VLRAGNIEGIVFDQLKILFRQPQVIVHTWKATQAQDNTISENDVRKGPQSIEALWDQLFTMNKQGTCTFLDRESML
jgi:site-specific DNA recombinase